MRLAKIRRLESAQCWQEWEPLELSLLLQCEQSAFPKGILQIFNKIKGSYTLECRNLTLNASTKSPEGDSCHVTIFSAAVPMVKARVQIQPPPPVMEEVGCGEHPH